MNSLKKITVLLLVMLAVVACKKDDDGGDGGNGGVGTFSANVSGASFSGDVAAVANEISAGGSTNITLQGSDASGRAMVIIISGFDGTGSYEISDDSVFTSASYTEVDVNNPQSSTSWVAPFANSGVVGEINVSEKSDTNIKGTFNFEAKEQNGTSMKNVTNGQFNLELTQN